MQLAVDGRKVYAATGGRPFDRALPATVFLHGAGCDHTVWQLPARWFAWHGASVLAVDLPGHGRSEGPPLTSIAELGGWVGRLLDAAGLDTAALVGHSMGAAIALDAAAALGPRIVRVALLGTAASIPVHKDLLAAAREEPQRAYEMMTAWAHGVDAKLGGHPVPGLWMTGGTLALFARNAPGVLHTDLAACAAWQSGAESARRVQLSGARGDRGQRHHDIAQGRPGAGPAHCRQPHRDDPRLRPHAGGRGARCGARCANRFLRAREGGLGGKPSGSRRRRWRDLALLSRGLRPQPASIRRANCS